MLIILTVDEGREIGALDGDSLIVNTTGINVVEANGTGSIFDYQLTMHDRTRSVRIAVDEAPAAIVASYNEAYTSDVIALDFFRENDSTHSTETKYILYKDISYAFSYDTTMTWLALRQGEDIRHFLIDGTISDILETALTQVEVLVSEDGQALLSEADELLNKE